MATAILIMCTDVYLFIVNDLIHAKNPAKQFFLCILFLDYSFLPTFFYLDREGFSLL